MATFGHNLILVLTWVMFLQNINCKPAKRTATDCYGTDCIIPQDELDFNGNPRDTELLENITGSMIRALPEITNQLKNIAYIHQNTTVPALPSIAKSLEDDKDLQTSQNILIENVTVAMTQMVKLMQSQQEMHERQTQLLQNHQAIIERHNQQIQEQSERQSRLLENVTASLHQTFLPLLTNLLQIQHDSVPHSCTSGLSSGQHMILPKNAALGSAFPVVCDLDTDGGGWIVFQRRFDGSVDFDRVWDDYATGFGNPDGEFWLGLEKLHVLTSRGRWELRVDLEDFDLIEVYAIYANFRVGDSASFYRLDIGSYSGTAGDGMTYSDWMLFTTKDQDHDQRSAQNCAIIHRGAWWHSSCTHANLNGLYLGQNGFDSVDRGMEWYRWKNTWGVSLKRSELKIRLIEG